MKLRSLRERELISSIRREFDAKAEGLVLGIGDDAAVIRGGKKLNLLTTDLLVEGVHFIASLNPPRFLGRKSLNVNLSDIAAMGGTPRFALLGLALRKNLDTTWVRGFFGGIKEAAGEADVLLVGGDISAAGKIAVSITVIGEAESYVPRSGARPGDWIYVSGFLGDAASGLRQLRKGGRPGRGKAAGHLIRAFLDPPPQIALGRALARSRAASSMIDTSDGLSIDLRHLCEESGTGAEIELARLPLSPAIRALERYPQRLALHGGEDYQLLFTVGPKKVREIERLSRRFRISRIGRMTRRNDVLLVDAKGRKRPLEAKGYEHFVARHTNNLARA
jgi:thiamine-monophosphate kinase